MLRLAGSFIGVSIITPTSNASPSWICFITGRRGVFGHDLVAGRVLELRESSLNAPVWAPVASTFTSAAFAGAIAKLIAMRHPARHHFIVAPIWLGHGHRLTEPLRPAMRKRPIGPLYLTEIGGCLEYLITLLHLRRVDVHLLAHCVELLAHGRHP